LQLNYFVKYIELIDTVFLMVKKKPLSKFISNFITGVSDKICSFLALLSPPRHGIALLHAAYWTHFSVLGSEHFELDRARCHVLVLLPECSRYSGFLEGVDHQIANHTIHHRSWLCLFRQLGLLHEHIRSLPASCWHLRRRAICSCRRRRYLEFIPGAVRLFLHRHVQKDVQSPKFR
jgi:hypothetical protein